jgi:hypothetical protein
MLTIFYCVRDGETANLYRGRGYRYGLPNQEYFKSGDEMKQFQITWGDFEYFGDCG